MRVVQSIALAGLLTTGCAPKVIVVPRIVPPYPFEEKIELVLERLDALEKQLEDLRKEIAAKP